MRTINLLVILLAIGIVTSFAQEGKNKPGELVTVKSVDLNRYSGKWFEIARYPNKYQKNCVGNTAATYTIKESGKIDVLNECLEKDGQIKRAKGKARIVDKVTNARLEVRFAPSFLSLLPFVWGDYHIIELAEDYKFAVVGDPKREYFWILSREPQIDDALYQAILRRAEGQGFDPARVYKTPQNVEVIKGEVILK